jgi:hypothetical protein
MEDDTSSSSTSSSSSSLLLNINMMPNNSLESVAVVVGSSSVAGANSNSDATSSDDDGSSNSNSNSNSNNDSDSDTSGTSRTTNSTHSSHPATTTTTTKFMTMAMTTLTPTPTITKDSFSSLSSSQPPSHQIIKRRNAHIHVSLLTTIISILLAILVGMSAGLIYSNNHHVVVSMNNNPNNNNLPSSTNSESTTTVAEVEVETETETEIVAPQCDDDDDDDDDDDTEASSSTKFFLEKKIEFKYVKIEQDDEDDDEDEEEEDDNEEDDEDESKIVYDDYGNEIFQGAGKILQFFINAYDIEYFDNKNNDNEDDLKDYEYEYEYEYDFENNGEEIITELLTDLIDASEECENIIELYGYFVHDSTSSSSSSSNNIMNNKKENSNNNNNKKNKTLNIVGMFRDGTGQVSLTLWPYHRKIMADFFIGPPRQVANNNNNKRNNHDDDDDNDDDDDEIDDDDDEIDDGILLSCISSMANVLYPNAGDNIIPNNIKGSPEDVTHTTQLGLFESIYKYNKDPYRFRWKIEKLRGFAPLDINDADLIGEMGSINTWKNRVVSVQSNFQQIDIVDGEDDYVTKGWMDSYNDIENPNINEIRDYMITHSKQFFQPDRLLYLDGVIQSTRQGLAAYHEALVQPAMFAHPNPKRIAIVGGGECATLRETLKHSTVEKVIMVEIDPIIVDVSKIYLEEWNDCSMFENSTRYCMDDPRVEMYHLDALQWFRDRYSNESQLENNILFGTEELFDVVILDAL